MLVISAAFKEFGDPGKLERTQFKLKQFIGC
jgi:hypothetical protein